MSNKKSLENLEKSSIPTDSVKGGKGFNATVESKTADMKSIKKPRQAPIAIDERIDHENFADSDRIGNKFGRPE